MFRFFQVVVFLAAVVISSKTLAAELESLEFSSLPGNITEIKLIFDRPVDQPVGYAIEKPARIALDFLGAISKLDSKYHSLGAGNARSLTVVQAKDRTRLIINLNESTQYAARVEGNAVYVAIGVQSVAPATAALVSSAQSAEDVVQRALTEIDFQRGEGGEGKVVISLSDPSVPIDVRQDGDRIMIEFVGAHLPERLRRRLDVTDFATPVTDIVTSHDGDNVVMIVRPTGDYDYLAYQADDQFTVSVKPVAAEELERRSRDVFVFTGEKLSLNFQDIEVRNVLQLIADFTSLNMVASDTVSGRITLRLDNVPWDQALDLILKTKGLDKRQVGNVMLVAPADEIAAREQLELKSQAQAEALAPLRSQFITINYAKASDILTLVNSDTSLLSARGAASVDERTNTLIILDTEAKLEEMRELITRLDVPVRQVLIEARIVLATTDFAKQLGVRWGGVALNGAQRAANGNLLSSKVVSGSSQNVLDVADGIGSSELTITSPDDMIVDLGVSAEGATSIALGIADLDSGMLQLELSALASDGHGDIIATPKVLTADQQEATVAAGTQVGYQVATSSGATAVSFANAELRLIVTPQITPDGNIIMDLQVNNDSIGSFTSAGIPAIDTNRLETTVLVRDGETVVLGGIFQTRKSQGVAKTPFFGDLPVLGRLFRREINSESKSELLIFITPRLVQDLLAAG